MGMNSTLLVFTTFTMMLIGATKTAGHGEGQADAAEELVRRDELQRGVQQQEVGEGPDPGLAGRVHEVEGDVGRLDAAGLELVFTSA
jgi:hypothetical protein